MSERESFEAHAKRRHLSLARGDCGYVYSSTNEAWEAWQASREALKDEQAVSEPWIACADRMPEEGGRYLCYVEEQNSLGKSHYQWNCSWNGKIWGGEMMYGSVTHWMPLPSPPAINHPIDTTSQQYEALSKGGEQ